MDTGEITGELYILFVPMPGLAKTPAALLDNEMSDKGIQVPIMPRLIYLASWMLIWPGGYKCPV